MGARVLTLGYKPAEYAPVGALAEIWTYGPITVDEIGAGELSALAGQLAANAAAPNRKTWVSSKGLKRS